MVDDGHDSSFDPKTWLKPTPAAPQTPAPAPQKKAPPPPPKLPDAAAPDYRNLMALGVAAAILLTGAATAAFSHKKPKSHAVVATVVAATASASSDDGTTTRTLTLASAGDLQNALTGMGIAAEDAQKAAVAATAGLGPARSGDIRLVLKLSGTSDAPILQEADVTYGDSSGTAVKRAGNAYVASPIAAVLKTVTVVKRGEIDTESFYSSAVTAGITDSLIPDFAKAFAYDFDFQREINPGDVFEAAFEETQNASGDVVGPPHLIYASLSTAAKSKALYFFKPASGDAGWFDGNGASIIKSFLRTPIDGAHITSQFGMRVHPVLGFMKMHKGTDFGAPIGTPIYAAGDATVNWAAMKGPNGNLVILQHDNGWQTFYLHMSRFGDGITAGVRVHQGQTIGYVGTTGRSTGPHLHYEMHIDGQPVDAMTVPMESGHSLTGADIAAFDKERDRIDVIRSQASE